MARYCKWYDPYAILQKHRTLAGSGPLTMRIGDLNEIDQP
jgi:hypothetical protein